MIQFTCPQYLESIKKGCTVIYGNKPYRVQDDGKGFLHIIVFEDGKRKKMPVSKVDVWFEFGSEADWVFNGWWKIYPDYELFKSFAENEKMNIGIN